MTVVKRGLARLLARAKPLVPPTLLPIVNVLRSVPGSGPLVGLPAFRRVLVLAAHPDDESIGCAGTVALLADSGAQVTMVFATDGEMQHRRRFTFHDESERLDQKVVALVAREPAHRQHHRPFETEPPADRLPRRFSDWKKPVVVITRRHHADFFRRRAIILH